MNYLTTNTSSSQFLSSLHPPAAQTVGPRPAAAAAATAPVRTIPQYKYTAGVRNPQQHINTQPPVSMQQVRLQRHDLLFNIQLSSRVPECFSLVLLH